MIYLPRKLTDPEIFTVNRCVQLNEVAMYMIYLPVLYIYPQHDLDEGVKDVINTTCH